jgi:hypothetical protein
MDNYEHLAMDEVYDILLYNPDVHITMKIKLIDNLLEHYMDIEEYQRCANLQELRLVMERENESNNKKT